VCINLECRCFRPCKSSERSREILKTSFVRKNTYLVCELFLSSGHVITRISRRIEPFYCSRCDPDAASRGVSECGIKT
jgi:hypothetical protein